MPVEHLSLGVQRLDPRHPLGARLYGQVRAALDTNHLLRAVTKRHRHLVDQRVGDEAARKCDVVALGDIAAG